MLGSRKADHHDEAVRPQSTEAEEVDAFLKKRVLADPSGAFQAANFFTVAQHLKEILQEEFTISWRV